MRRILMICAGAALLAPAADAAAQSLAQRIAATNAGLVRFSFPAKPGVCGDGESIELRTDSTARDSRVIRGGYRRGDDRFDETGRLRTCEPGPVIMELELSNGRIVAATARVGGPPRDGGRDLGMQEPASAVAYLLARETVAAADRDAVSNLIFAATLAPVESWPALLRLARARDLDSRARGHALFWLSQAAGDRATAGLQSIIGDDADEIEVREMAVFALSRVESDSTIPQLMRIARTNPEPAVRRSAMFWLGRSGDARVIDFFEQILRGR